MANLTESPVVPTTLNNQVPTDPLALTFIVLFAASEIIGSSKIKSNGVIQLILRLISSLKPARKEDEIIVSLHQDIKDLTDSVAELRQAVRPTPRYRQGDDK
jgi:hypothetical protein